MFVEINESLPALYATSPASDVSDKYRFISTAAILEQLISDGFQVVEATQGASRNRNPHACHRVELIHPSMPRIEVKPGDWARMRVVLFNSHDRSQRFCLHAGMFRACCQNGLVFGESAWAETVRTKHLGTVPDFIEGVYRVIDSAKGITHQIREMATTPLTREARTDFASKALALRWKDSPFQDEMASLLLKPRRELDEDETVWTVYNCLQEKLIQGRTPVPTLTQTGYTRYRRATRITSVHRDRKINTQLWELAQSYVS